MNDGLKNCPFCGSDHVEAMISGSRCFVTCHECDAVGLQTLDDSCESMSKAVAAWNDLSGRPPAEPVADCAMVPLTLPPLPEQAGWGVEMHGHIVLFANNTQKANGQSLGARTPLFTADQLDAYARAAIAKATGGGS